MLIRHAKAADGDVDLERPLTEAGRRDAAAIGVLLRELAAAPDRAVVSPSRRTVQTWEAAAIAGAPIRDERVYDNTPEALLAVIRETPASTQTLAVVGHNPSISALAGMLDDGSGDAAAATELRRGFPAAAVAVFDVPLPFAELAAGTASLIAFRPPAR